MKLIRELRMGPPKSAKTVAVVGTYPKPMLVFLFDKDGIDVIPSQPISDATMLKLDVTYKDVVEIPPMDLIKYCKMKPEELPKVTVIAFYKLNQLQMTDQFIPFAADNAYKEFVNCVNYLVAFGCPWKTYVLDSVTSLCDTMMSSIAKNQHSMLSDARKWSPAVGGKVLQHIGVLNNLPIHCVYIAHSHMEKNETTGDVSILPLGPNRFSEQVGAIVSQYFYATTESGSAKIWTKPKGNVKAIGCRWPSGLAQEVSADFKSIYGKELTL